MSITVPLAKHWVSTAGKRLLSPQCSPGAVEDDTQAHSAIQPHSKVLPKPGAWGCLHCNSASPTLTEWSVWPEGKLQVNLTPKHLSATFALQHPTGPREKDSALWEANEWCHCWAESTLTSPNHSPAGLLVSLPCSSDHFQVMRQGLQGRPMAEEGYCWSFSKASLLSELCLILLLRLLHTHTHTHPQRLLPHSRNR